MLHIDKLDDIIANASLHFIKYKNGNKMVFSGIYKNKPIIMFIRPYTFQNLDNKQITKCKKIYDNEKFSQFVMSFNNKYDINIIWPANDKDLASISCNNRKRIIETPLMYKTLTYPKIKDQTVKWINNILDGKSEVENIIHNDQQFIMLPDIKWNGFDKNEIHCLAIVKNKNLKSIRDLNRIHIPLLQHIYDVGIKVIKKKYNVDWDKLKVYLHYYPTYWHMHIHFCNVQLYDISKSVNVAHSLLSVINNISISSDYYQKVNMEILVKCE